MIKSKSFSKIFLALALIAFLLALIAAGVYFSQKLKLTFNRPLVLIFNPINQEHIILGDSVMVNANARTKVGVERIELWIDGSFIYAREAAEGQALPAEMIMVPWDPIAAGKHTILVRAYSTNGVDGQASIAVIVEEAVSEELLSEETENNDGGTGMPASEESTEVLTGGAVPGGGSPSGGAPPPSDGEPAPSDSLPGSLDDIGDSLGLGSDEPETVLSEEPIGVRVEALTLFSPGSYESLHCYIEAGLLPPQWYPDVDHDQTTNESFASLGAGEWDIASHLGGSNGPIFMWPGNEIMPLNVNCVGIYEDGAESDELGNVSISASPESWDGVVRRVESAGGEGSFFLDYRFSLGPPDDGVGFPITLDPDMTTPTNVRIEDSSELQWDWVPSTDPEPEEPPDGFYIYLNGSRQFVIESSEARGVTLPPEWEIPPCGIEYVYTVTAWRWNPDDPTDILWSNHSEPLVISRDVLEECDVRAHIIFETLTVTGLEAHPDEGRTDQVGPIAVAIYDSSGFSVASSGWCTPYSEDCGGLRLAPDFPHSLEEIMLLSGNSNHHLMPIPAEGITLGYVVYNQNSSGSEEWCEGAIHVPFEEFFDPSGDIEYHNTLVSRSPDARCEVAFTISTVLTMSDYRGIEFPPLPSLYVEEIVIDEVTGTYDIHVMNANTATWLGYDLDVLLTRNSGEEISRFVWPDLTLEPGEGIWINDESTPSIERPNDLCVTLDPDNTVLESVERTMPGWQSPPFCLEIPDLVITGAGFTEDDRTLGITVQNQGSGPLTASSIEIAVFDSSRGGIINTYTEPVGALGLLPWETISFEIVILDTPLETLEHRTNYTVILDPSDVITESNEENNTFSLEDRAGTFEVRLNGFDYATHDGSAAGYTWTGLYVPWYDVEDAHNHDWFIMTVFVDNGFSRREVGAVSVECVIPRGLRGEGPTSSCQAEDPSPDNLTFDLVNGEEVIVRVSGHVNPDGEADLWTRLGAVWFHFDFISSGGGWCDDLQPYGERHWSWVYPPRPVPGLPWATGVTLCRVGP